MKEIKKYSNQLKLSFDHGSKIIVSSKVQQEEKILCFKSENNKRSARHNSELIKYVLNNTKSF